MIVNGIDLDGLAAHKSERPGAIPVVSGRVVHIDADFLAYQCSYEKKDDPKDLDDMKHNVGEAIGYIKGMSGATHSILHLTPQGSDKGGRFDIALLKEYQANRRDKEKPRYLNVIRDFMHTDLGAIMHMDCEADDGMSIAQWSACQGGQTNASVIATKDKDLNMVPGWHLDWDTGELIKPDSKFGFIFLDEGGKTKKLRGYGTKFFWAQMLMGDSADNISGLPKVTGRVAAARYGGKDKLCGPVGAYEILADIPDNLTAFAVIKALYQDYGENFGFVNWRDGSSVAWQSAMVSEMQLLWMRRSKDPNDVLLWLADLKELMK